MNVFFSLCIFIPRDLHRFCTNVFFPLLISSHTCESRVKIHSIGFIFILFFFFVVTAILFRFTSKVFLLDFYLVQTSKYI